MTFRQYLIIMTTATILCWAAWVIVLFNVDPFHAGLLNFIFFYFSLFLALLGTISLSSIFVFHFWSKSDELLFRYVKRSFRYGFITSLLLIALLYFQASGLLNYWNLGALILIIILFALFIWSSHNGKKNPNI